MEVEGERPNLAASFTPYAGFVGFDLVFHLSLAREDRYHCHLSYQYARLKAGLTQAQLASKLGIRQNMVSDYENGRLTYSDSASTFTLQTAHNL